MAGVPQRFIATRHRLEITTSEQNIPKAWESVITFCGTPRCEALSSSITTKTSGSRPSGTISLRTAPEDLKSLLAYFATQGTIVQHTTENEDKTAAVVDAEARLKNLTSFRDSLRAMQAKPSVAVKDLVEIQKHLTDVQSQLTARQPSGKSWRTKRRKLP
jgi:cob(I)alamin adenosyltransferase